ncbi:MAG: hypothetical protein K6G26_02655 [Lachnospiraceae bacterium]|nr:hypothetical protein [Lachnospiraceae bacterium]
MMNKKIIMKVVSYSMCFIMVLGLVSGNIITAKADSDVATVIAYGSETEVGYKTIQEAFTAVEDGGTIKLLDDITVAEGETLTINTAVTSLYLDLNGKTITNKGTIKGGDYEDNNGFPNVVIEGKKTGIINSSGTLAIALSTWYADTINITGGKMTKHLGVDGGTVNISGGEVTGGIFVNNGGEADINFTISGDAKIKDFDFFNYHSQGDPSFSPSEYDAKLIITGGYFEENPTAYKSYNMGGDDLDQSEYITMDETKIEKYSDQTDWEADKTVYTYRILETKATEAPATETPATEAPAATKEPLYKNTEGAGSSFAKDTTDTLKFIFKRTTDDSKTFEHFTGIKVDGKVVDKENYTAKAGSVIIELKASYLKTLDNKEHTLTAMFDDDNDVEAKFTVAETSKKNSSDSKTSTESKTASPKTGDNTNILLCVILMVVSIGGIGAGIFFKKKYSK